jgi:CubicO group peptidase (beta-lactamase class C family)
MARFEVAILNDRLVKRPTRDIMWTPQMPSDGLGRMVYGLGWEAGTSGTVGDVGHGGSQQGTSTMMLIAPDARAGVVVLINSDASGASEFASQLLAIVLGLPSRDHKEITVDVKLYDGYIGSYQMNDFRLTFAREGDRLFAQLNGQKIQVFPEGVRDYFSRSLTLRSPL